MKIVCICDAGAPEMLMENVKKLPGCDVDLFIDPAMLDIKNLTIVERTAEKGGSEAFEASREPIGAVTGADAIITHVTPVNKAKLLGDRNKIQGAHQVSFRVPHSGKSLKAAQLFVHVVLGLKLEVD